MLSKRKIKAYLLEWLRAGLSVPMERGMSLKDDTDGTSLYVDSVTVEGHVLKLALTVLEGDEPLEQQVVYLLLQSQATYALGPSLGIIDDETS